MYGNVPSSWRCSVFEWMYVKYVWVVCIPFCSCVAF